MKPNLPRTLFSLTLCAVLALGFFGIPTDAVATQCSYSMMGCDFSHVSYHDDPVCAYACCEFLCPDGSYLQGNCWYA